MLRPQALAEAKGAIESLHGGDLVAARRKARAALRIDPDLAEAHEVLAQLAGLSDRYSQKLKHWSAAIADGRSEMVASYLGELSLGALGRDETLGLLSLLSSLEADHRCTSCRVSARRKILGLFAQLGYVESVPDAKRRLGLIGEWQAIAGFDNADGRGFEIPYGPETDLDFSKTYALGRTDARWRALKDKNPVLQLDLLNHFFPFTQNVAYLATHLQSPTSQSVSLWLQSSDPIKVWLNGRLLFASREIRGSQGGSLRIPVTLRKGNNTLLLKSCQGSGAWLLSAGLVGKSGRPAEFALGGRPSKTVAPQPQKLGPEVAIPAAVSALPPGPRRSYWTARALSRAGFRHAAIQALDGHLRRWPNDPLALALAATQNQREGHKQRMTQMLDRGLNFGPKAGAHFYIAKAASYRRRGQHDKAFALLDTLDKLNKKNNAGGGPKAVEVKSGRGESLERYRLFAAKGWTLDRCRIAKQLAQDYPDWSGAYGKLASCSAALGRSGEAERWLARGVELSPIDPSLRSRWVRTLLSLGNCLRANIIQSKTVDYWPSRIHDHIAMGDVLRRCGGSGVAISAYGRAAQISPRWDKPFRYQGLVLFELGQVDKAVETWKKALERNPDDADLWERISRIQPDRDPVMDKLRPTDADIRQRIAAAASTKTIDGASILWILDHEVTRLMPDGTTKRVVTIIRSPLDSAGRDSLGEMKLPRRGLLKVLDAYVLDKRGRRQEVTSLHGRKVRFPKVEEGAVVVVQYRHIQRPSGYLKEHLASSWTFQHSLGQVKEAAWVLAIPPQRKLSVSLQGKIEHSETKEHGLTIHRFVATDVEPLRPEPNSPPAADLLRTAVVSTVPSWDYFSAWGRSLTADVFETDTALDDVIAEIAKRGATVAQRLKGIYHFALTQIRYQQDYETFIAGVKPHSAVSVLSRGYGDCKDKSGLIIAMLRKLGIEAHLALVKTRGAGNVQAEVPSQQFNHAVVYVPQQEGLEKARFLDATAESLDLDSLRSDTQGTLSLVLFPDGHRLIPIGYQDAKLNTNHTLMDLKIDDQGNAAGKVTMRLHGQRAGALRKPIQNKQILGQFIQSVAHSLYPGTRADAIRVKGDKDIVTPLQLEFGFRANSVAQREGDTLRLRLPKPFSPNALARWATRRHPLFFGPPSLITRVWQAQLPEGVTMQSLPKDATESAACLALHGRWQWHQETRVLSYQMEMKTTCPEVSPADYPQLREAVTRFDQSLLQEVVLSTSPEGKTKPKPKTKKRRRKKG